MNDYDIIKCPSCKKQFRFSPIIQAKYCVYCGKCVKCGQHPHHDNKKINCPVVKR